MEKLVIVRDEFAGSPRHEFENLGTIVYKHSKYVLGDVCIDDPIDWLEDKLGLKRLGEYSNERLDDLLELFYRKYVGLNLYLYDHSGITISTEPFSCPWDSSMVGFIYVDKEKIRKEFGVKNVTQKLMKTVKEILKHEIEIYDLYLRGEIYGFKLYDKDDNLVDSCYGFYGTNWGENGMKDYVPKELHYQLDNLLIEE